MPDLDFTFRTKVPLLLQTEVAECGLACMAMVASHLGYQCDVRSLRASFSASLKGLNLKHMMQLADRCGLASRAVQCELDELVALQLPAILHWDLNHFVVLTRVSANSVQLNDPALGQVRMNFKDLSKHFSGIALELKRGPDFQPAKTEQRLAVWQLWSRISHLASSLGLLFLLALMLQVAGIASPYYMQWVVDHVLLTKDRDLLLVLALGFGLLMLCSLLLSTLRSWLVMRMSSVVNLQMGVNLLQHLLHLPLEFYSKRHIGDIVSRFGSLGQVRERLTTGIVETLVDGVMASLLLVVMLFYSVSLTLVVIASVLIYILARIVTYGALYRASELTIKSSADEQTNFLENVRGIQAIKLFGAESDRLGYWQNRYTDVINSEIRLGKLNLGFSLVSGLIFGVENILIIYLAANEVLLGSLTIGMVLAFIAYKNQLSGRLTGLVEQWIAFRMLRLHLDRLADIALAEPEPYIDRAPLCAVDTAANSKIVVRNLSFRYGDNESAILDQVSFSVETGEMVAVVGPSGSGKSTLIRLLLGLYRPTSGSIHFAGVEIGQLGLGHYRQLAAAVMQGDGLIAGSVTDNISFFDLQPDQERVKLCAEAAAIHHEITALPMGYHSLVGDMGSQFSGGQVQRLLLARALYRDPQVLFLDEATSHLDMNNERHITRHVAQLGITRFVVAHREETIQGADKILLVKAGRVEAMTPRDYLNLA